MASKKHRGSKKRGHNKTKNRTKKGGAINMKEVFQKILNSMGATFSGNRSTKFHIQKCMQKELGCERHGIITSRLQRTFQKAPINRSEECDKIKTEIDKIRQSQGYGGFIYRNLARNSPLRILYNIRILSLFHHVIYTRPNEEEKLPMMLRLLQHRFFRGGFKFFDQYSDKEKKKSEDDLAPLLEKARDNTPSKTAAANVRNLILDSNNEEAGKSQILEGEQSDELDFLREATDIFNKEREEIKKHVGDFDGSYCLSIEEHEFLLKSFHKLWMEPVLKQNNLKGGGSFVVMFKRFWVNLFIAIGSAGAFLLTLGFGALQNIATAEMGCKLIIGGAILGGGSILPLLVFKDTFQQILKEKHD